MSDALHALQVVTALGFVGLGLITLADWLRHRERSRGYLALAIGMIGVTSLLGQVQVLTNYQFARLIQDLSLLIFMASGYALLLFRDTFIPLDRRLRNGALVACAVSTAFAIAVNLPYRSQDRPSPVQSAATILLILVWSACVMEPTIRLWAASRHRPAVQRARLRALGAGYSAIVLILLVAGFGGSAVTSPVVQLLFQIVVLVSLPLLLVSFAPPVWLRRLWRQTEEEELRGAIHDLILFSPDRPTLARRASEWAVRLVGAEGVAIVEPGGELLAVRGIEAKTARELAAQLDGGGLPQLLTTPGSTRENAIVLPLPLDSGKGAMVVVSGPYTPFFGSDEVLRLRGYAANITAALDRARVTERLAALEKTKSQFLNLASHELRSPLGVINGYLSMLEQGALGQLKEPGTRAIGVLKAKALEMNLLVSQMLDAARLEDGRLALKRERDDLRMIARDALDVVRPLAAARHEVVIEAPGDAVPVYVDHDRLTTILSNLLENAIKYSPKGGVVRMTIAQENGAGTVSVTDSGVGIEAEDLPRLFNRFERIHNRETSHVGGTGLGLYLSRELARQHGGELTVESQPHKGSTFTLRLPLATPVVSAETEPETEPERQVEPALTSEVPTRPVQEPAIPRLRVVGAEGESESQPA